MDCNVYVDLGNHTTNAMHRGQIIVIPTLMKAGEDRVYQGAYLVEYNNDKYVIGDTNSTENTNITLSKMDMAHKMTLYTSVHQLVDNLAELTLFIGMPITSYFNAEHRREYVNYMNDSIAGDWIKFKVNGKTKNFKFKKVVALPESVGYIFNNPTNKLIGVVDIGHLTCDGAIFKDSMPLSNSVFTTLDGADSLKTQIRDRINRELLLNVQDYQMDEIIVDGMYGIHSEKAMKIVEECCVDFLRTIIKEMVKHGWEITTLPVIFTGGGSVLLKTSIEMVETFSISKNPFYDNLYGFEQLGVIASD